MKKIFGVFVMMLLIITVIPNVNSSYLTTNKINNYDDYRYSSDIPGYGSFIKKDMPKDPNYIAPKQNIIGVPDYFNWKDFGGQDWTTTAKDQRMCGSCYIFAAVGIIESVINIKEGSAVIDADLSEQYVISCLPNSAYYPGYGCNGGEPSWVLQLIMATTPEGNYHNGALLEECFPYKANDITPCEDKCPDWEDKLIPITDTLQWYPTGSSEDTQLIKSQIMEKGPLTTCIGATNDFASWIHSHHDPNDYYPYVKIEFDDLNHDIIIVGWKDDPIIRHDGYWICKNSWGTDEGYDGFFNIEYGSLKIDSSLINWVDYDPETYEWDDEPNPPGITTITGLTKGNISTEYEYTLNVIDPEGRSVKYYISWGDGDWEWTDYHPSGEDVIVKHTWEKKGDYSVVSLAMNTDSNIGSWGTLEISMSRNKSLNEFNPWLFRLIQRFPILKSLL